jgi:asparagine synthase (glutamine-hydrolysing)
MLLAAPHRGSDLVLLTHGACALGASHNSDFADASTAQAGRWAVAFTGLLDNRHDIGKELGWQASRIDAATPADVLLASFERFGETVLSRLRGVYAAVVTDGRKAWCFRDHLGFRSLFYRIEDDRAFIATEAKQVVEGAGIAREPDVDVVQKIFWSLMDDESPSSLRGVMRLPKATVLSIDEDRASVNRYWRPEELLESRRLSPVEFREEFLYLFDRSVARVMDSESILSLSGGVDSPAVAAFAAPIHRSVTGARLPAISAVYPDQPAVDESRYIRIVVDALDLDWHTYVQRTSTTEGLLDWVALADGPVQITGLSECAEDYRTIRALGHRSILTGELAEYVVERRRYLVSHLLSKGRLGATWGQLAAQRAKGVGWLGIGRQLITPLVPASAMRFYTRTRQDEYGVLPDWVDRTRGRLMHTRTEVSPAKRWLREQLVGFIGPSPGMEADETCQAVCGVRVRRPWADVDLWEFFLSLRAEAKFPDARVKSVIRAALRGKVPDEILDRKDKTTFNDSTMARIDYSSLRRFLLAPSFRIDGVDYKRLAEHLDHEDLDIVGFSWAKDLASIHAFLTLWDRSSATEAV